MKNIPCCRSGKRIPQRVSPPPDPRTNRRDLRQSAGFGLGFYEDREGLFGIYEDMSWECVRIPCPDQTRYPRINCNIALGGKASDGSAGPLIRARSISDSRHQRATVKRSATLSNNPSRNPTALQRKCWNEIAKSPNFQLQLLSVLFWFWFFFFHRRATEITLPFLLSLVNRTLHSPLKEFMGSQGNVWTRVSGVFCRVSCDRLEFSLFTACKQLIAPRGASDRLLKCHSPKRKGNHALVLVVSTVYSVRPKR